MTYNLGKWDFTLRNTYFSGVTLIGTNGILGYDEELDKIIKEGNEAEWRDQVSDVYKPRITTDILINYAITKKIGFAVGGNNILDVYPNIRDSASTDGGAMWDAVQMGFQGAYFFSRATIKF
jgi:outer membrane receptor protein involved in Fe transport